MADSATAAQTPTRTALIGAGFIAEVHMMCLQRVPGVAVVAVVDPSRERAASLARRFKIPRVFASVDELVAAQVADAVHVLVPPQLHVPVATQCLRAGLHTLVEKPLAMQVAEVQELRSVAASHAATLAVNHNMTWLPVVQRLRDEIASGRIGRLERLQIVHEFPLRQLAAGPLDHFVFQSPANILYEQGVHLFSLVHALAGDPQHVTASATPGRELANGAVFHDGWSVLMRCAKGTATVSLGFGPRRPTSRLLALGTDGTMEVDLLRGTWQRQRKTRWLDAFDTMSNGLRAGISTQLQGIGSGLGYVRSLLKLGGPSDPFLQGMLASLADFHAALREGRQPACDGRQARAVARMCQEAADRAGVSRAVLSPWQPPEPGPARPGEVLVTGGTGFLGRSLVPQLLEAGRPVTLLIRRPGSLPTALQDERIRYLVGDATDADAMARACAGVSQVVHMATCASSDPAAIEASMVAGIQAVAEACLAQKVQRMVFVSSTAALYLGASGELRDGGPDPKPGDRPPYARGKIAAEKALAAYRDRLDTVVLRPAIVVGAGAVPEHSGLGLWVQDNHCVGWGSGQLSLPFVLARDVASAIVGALDAEGIAGQSFNLAGDVRPSAQVFLSQLRAVTGRDYQFHPTPLWATWGIELGKWIIKRLVGRRGAFTTLRDLRSRAFRSVLVCDGAKQALGWQPEADPERFMVEAIEVHAPRG